MYSDGEQSEPCVGDRFSKAPSVSSERVGTVVPQGVEAQRLDELRHESLTARRGDNVV